MPSKPDKRTRRAAVVARDKALSDSLALLLDVAGLETVVFNDVGSLVNQARLTEDFIFLDVTEQREQSALSELRNRGWTGTAVAMIDGLRKSEISSLDASTLVLAKPFSSSDVLAIISG